jgi:hypothetical protein
VQCGGARAEPRSAAGGWRSAAVCGRHHLPHQRDECRYVTCGDGKHGFVACRSGITGTWRVETGNTGSWLVDRGSQVRGVRRRETRVRGL